MEREKLIRQNIHRRIEELRKQKRMTQQEFAVALDLDPQKGRVKVNNWEQGLANVKSGDIVKIAETFSVSADWLLGLVNDQTQDIEERAILDFTRLSESSLKFQREYVKGFLEDEVNSFLPESAEFFIMLQGCAMHCKKAKAVIENNSKYTFREIADLLRDLKFDRFLLLEEAGKLPEKLYGFDGVCDSLVELLRDRKKEGSV